MKKEIKTVKEEIAKTLQALVKISEDDPRLSQCGFSIDDSDTRPEPCVLVMGLNPAGDSDDAIRDSGNVPYLYYLGDATVLSPKLNGHVYAAYYKQIYDMVAATTEGDYNIKWPWCNLSMDEICSRIESEIPEFRSSEDYRMIKEFYDKKKQASTTIYIGDMFYYYQTNSKELLDHYKYNSKPKANKSKDYFMSMLKYHIEILKKHNKKIRYIYINNAYVSHGLCVKQVSSVEDIEGIPVFYGSMLSGQRAMDSFSKMRLIREIKEKMR